MHLSEFQHLWDTFFSPITKATIPGYNDYRDSERMLEDYLDIFRGYNTREGTEKMPYDHHPYFDKNGNPLLNQTPKIRFILVGEARPAINKTKLNGCTPIDGDISNSYFYDIRHIKQTPWLSAPRLNWSCPKFKPCPSNKVQTLLCLASNGVLLLDLFPFAIKYTSNMRKKLNNSGATRSFWDNPSNPFGLQNRIQRIGNLLDEHWDLSMVAPCLISECIVNPAYLFPPLSITPTGLHPTTFRDTLFDKTRCVSCNSGQHWKKITVSQQAPTARLIGLSF